MRKNIFIILLLSSFSLFAGTYAGDFTTIAPGVKALGMGGAFTAVADDGSASYFNSAGISNIKQTEVSAMRAFLYEDLATYDFLSYCQPLPNDVTIGVSWTRLTIDDIPEFSEEHLIGTIDYRTLYAQLTGIPDSEFSSTDDLLQFTFSKHKKIDLDLGWLFFDLPLDTNFGGSIKYITRKIGDIPGNGVGFDFGFITRTSLAVLFDVDWMGDFAIGANFKNVNNTKITWDTESNHEDEIPYSSTMGYAIFQKLPWYDLDLIYTWDVDYSYENIHHYGAELRYLDLAAIRTGYHDDNWSAGLSLSLYNFTLDYAFIQNSNIEKHTNRIGLKYNF